VSVRSILVMDVGGTFIRWGVYADGRCTRLRSEPAPWVHEPCSPERFINALLELVARGIALAPPDEAIAAVAVSVGACLDQNRGIVLASAPIFGRARVALPISDELRRQLPRYQVYVLNDVAALCWGHVAAGECADGSEIAALTVSSGIALRRLCVSSGRIPVDAQFGIQGEVGHLPAFGEQGELCGTVLCDCGSPRHVASYASGNGLRRCLQNASERGHIAAGSALAAVVETSSNAAEAISLAALDDDLVARSLLAGAARQLAGIIHWTLSICPEVSRIFVTGGVISAMWDTLPGAAHEALQEESYIYDDRFLRSRVRWQRNADDLGLLGAGLFAERCCVG
jgi:2-epi-5-epi-valiolone 7-kinase